MYSLYQPEIIVCCQVIKTYSLNARDTILLMLKKLLGDDNAHLIRKAQKIVKEINAFEPAMRDLSDEELFGKTQVFKERLASGETLDDILTEAFATVREVAVRETGLRPYDVQLIGGILMHQGTITEMKTGEGKTLVATMPTYLHALSGKGAHVVTVNDYLSRRDAVWVGQIHARLGMSIGIINSQESFLYDIDARAEHDEERDEVGGYKIVHDFLKPCSRKEAYAADITYGTNNEFGFDYLRDNLEFNPDNLRQRGYNFAIVDEVDSVLIDEARTPLIISSAAADSDKMYSEFAKIAKQLQPEKHYTKDEKYKAINLTDEGIEEVEQILGVQNLYTEGGIKYVHHLESAVRAEALFDREKDYVVQNGEIVIVDEFTGRLQPGRRWSDGMHQAIEAKEGITVQKESKTVASVTFQNYFRMYDTLTGMTGTAESSKEEFFKVYQLDVAVVPTNKPITRIDNTDLIFQTENGKFTALARKVKELQKKGQPVLIGTVAIESSERLSEFLKKEGIKHEILNAKNHEREGEIVADAGRKGAVTVATNMAGRGVDIKLGGAQATQEEYEEVLSLGGLYVIGTERHDARRIDNQLRGRSGRQGDAGETQFYVSMQDSLMRVFAGDAVKNMMGKMGLAEDEAIKHKMISKSLESAQTRIEGFNFDSRKHVLQYDDVLNTQRTAVYEKRRVMLVGETESIAAVFDEFAARDEKFSKAYIEKREILGDERFFKVARDIYLQTINTFWMEHLETMDYIRSSVKLRSYGQRDPLVEYKKDGLVFYKQMLVDIDNTVMDTVERISTDAVFELEKRAAEAAAEAERIIDGSGKVDESTKAKPKTKKKEDTIGRNDPCHCGSGKKYKKCHG